MNETFFCVRNDKIVPTFQMEGEIGKELNVGDVSQTQDAIVIHLWDSVPNYTIVFGGTLAQFITQFVDYGFTVNLGTIQNQVKRMRER